MGIEMVPKNAEWACGIYNFLDNGAGDLMLVLFENGRLTDVADDDNAKFIFDGFEEALLLRNSNQIVYLPVIAAPVCKMLGKIKKVLVTEVEGKYTNVLAEMVEMANNYDDCYETPVEVLKKPQPLLQTLAGDGYAGAQYFLAICYYEGEIVDQNYAKAAEWFRKAAEQGHALAQANLGACYSRGEGVAQDYAQAAVWLGKAAAQGNEVAQNTLANLRKLGKM